MPASKIVPFSAVSGILCGLFVAVPAPSRGSWLTGVTLDVAGGYVMA